MHIVHLMASPFVGGPERQVLGLARHLPPDTRTTFLSFPEHGRAISFIDEAHREGLDAALLKHNAPHFVAAIREIAEALRERGADVLCCSGYKPDLLGWRAARRAGVPVVSISHGWTASTPRVRMYELLDRLVLHAMDAVVCVSAAQARRVRRALVPERKIVVIPNAIAAGAFAPSDPTFRTALTKLFPEPPRYIVGAAGRLSPEKNFALFVTAAARVASRRGDVGFVLFGDGPLRGTLTEQATRLGLSKRFVFAGFHADVAKYLPNLDLAVLSSTTEGLPVVMLETFAAGVPMVATAVGGVPEVLEHGKSGLLVPSGASAALADGIVDLLGDDAARRALGRHAREHVRKHFSFEQQAGRYRKLFDRLGYQAAG